MIDLIVRGVYISDAASVIGEEGKKQIQELNIRRILTASAMSIPMEDRLPGVEYKFVHMMDMNDQDMLENGLLDDVIDYIDKHVSANENLLVHCEGGVSRSVALVSGYLMRKFHWSVDAAIMYIQKKRPIASPNFSFLQQLTMFEHYGYRSEPPKYAA